MDLRTFRILAPVARIHMFYVLLVDFSSGGGAVILWRVMMDGGVGGGRRLIARTCKVFRFARKLNTAPADLESRLRAPQRGGLGLGLGLGLGSGSGLGSGWSGHRVVLCGPAHREPMLPLPTSRADLKPPEGLG